MNYNIEDLKHLSIWMVERIARNKSKFDNDDTIDVWNWIAGEIWDFYPGIVNEFLVNDAIDLIVEAAECSE